MRRRTMVARRRMRGNGFFGDIGNWFKGAANTVADGVRKGANWVKDQKLISKGLGLAAGMLPGAAGTAAKIGAAAAGQLGLGRRRRRVGRPHMRGGARRMRGSGNGIVKF